MRTNVKCSRCAAEGLASKVFPGLTLTTAAWCPPFYDEDGVFHSHDSNVHATEYRCTIGHAWSEERVTPCPVEDCQFNLTAGVRRSRA